MASEEENRIAANKERVGPVLADFCESLIEVVFAACIDHVDHLELKPVCARRGFSVCDFGLTEGIVGIDEIVDHGGGGRMIKTKRTGPTTARMASIGNDLFLLPGLAFIP